MTDTLSDVGRIALQILESGPDPVIIGALKKLSVGQRNALKASVRRENMICEIQRLMFVEKLLSRIISIDVNHDITSEGDAGVDFVYDGFLNDLTDLTDQLASLRQNLAKVVAIDGIDAIVAAELRSVQNQIHREERNFKIVDRKASPKPEQKPQDDGENPFLAYESFVVKFLLIRAWRQAMHVQSFGLGAAISALIDDLQQQKERGAVRVQALRQVFAKNFDWAPVHKQYEAVFDQLRKGK